MGRIRIDDNEKNAFSVQQKAPTITNNQSNSPAAQSGVTTQNKNPQSTNVARTTTNNIQTVPKVTTPTVTKSAYQANLSKPVQTNTTVSTTRQLLGDMYNKMQTDPQTGNKMQRMFVELQSNPQSQFYAPYRQPTSMAMKSLAGIGFDTSVLSDDWMEANQGWIRSNLIYNGTTTTPSKPGKNATWDQQAAYYCYLYDQDEATTKKFEQQYDAAKEEVSYWAGRTDLNLSPEEIMGRVNWDKYDLLEKADEGRGNGKLLELNRGTDYSKDAFYGVIWATRNGGSTGSIWQDMARSAVDEGQWKENPEIAAKLNWNDKDTYAPYQVGMTANDVGLYFGVQKMTRADLDGIRRTIDPNDATAMKMYEAAEAAVSNTEQGQSEVKLFMDKLNDRLRGVTDPDAATAIVDQLYNGGIYDKTTKTTNSLSMLHKLDDSLNGDPKDLVQTTDAIDWRLQDIYAYAENVAKNNSETENGVQAVAGVRASAVSGGASVASDVPAAGAGEEANGTVDTPVEMPSAQEIEAIKAQDKVISEASGLIEDVATPAETATLKNAGTTAFGWIFEQIGKIKPADVFNYKMNEMAVNGLSTALDNYQGFAAYEHAEAMLPALQAEIADLEGRVNASEDELNGLNDLRALLNAPDLSQYGGAIDIAKYSKIRRAMDALDSDTQQYVDENGTHMYLMDLYEAVTGESVSPLDADAYDAAMHKAEGWYEYLKSDKEATGTLDESGEERLRYLKIDERNYQRTMEENQEAYAEYKRSQQASEALVSMLDLLGVDTRELKASAGIGKYLNQVADYRSPQREEFNIFDQMQADHGANATYEDVKEEAAEKYEETKEAYENLLFVNQYLNEKGIELPNALKNKLTKYEKDINSELRDYEYFSLQGEPDFASLAEQGKKLEASEKPTVMPGNLEHYDRLTSTDFGLVNTDFYSIMTETEKNTYYYLYAAEGREAATAYYDHLANGENGVLQTRAARLQEEAARAEVDSGFLGGLWANTKAVLSTLPSSAASLAYLAYTAITGEEINPDNAALMFNRYANTVNKATSDSIKNVFKDNPVAQKIVGGLYEMAYNRGRSFVNSLATGGITSGIENPILQELVGATPMATIAMMDSVADAFDKDAEPWQAWLIGAATFIAEDFTEGLTYGNIKDTITGSTDEVIVGVRNLMKNWLTNSGVEELFGESLSDIIGNIADREILGVLSDHQDRINRIKAENKGITDTEAELMAGQEEMAELVHTAVISYLGAGLDVPVSVIKSYVGEYQYAAALKKKYKEKNGIDLGSISSIRKDYHEQRLEDQGKTQNSTYEPKKTEGNEATNPNFEVEDVDVDALLKEKETAQDRQTAKDVGALTTVQNADEAANTAATKSVFNTETMSEVGDVAQAAAVNLPSILGGTAKKSAQTLKNILLGVKGAGVELADVKTALQTASLSESSEARRVVSSPEFAMAGNEERASMLAGTVKADSENATVAQEVKSAAYEFRVAEAEKPLIANGALDGTKKASDARDSAIADLNTARTELQKKTAEKEAKGQAMANAAAELNQNPSDENRKNMDRALNELSGAITAEDQYAQNVDNMQGKANKAQQDLNDVRDREMTALRQQAEARVAEIDQERAQFAEQQRVLNEAREKAIAKAREDENFSRLNAEEVVDELFPNISEDDRKYALGMVMAVQRATSQDANSWLARGNFAKSFAKKFNLKWQTVQNAPYNARVNPKTGTLEVSSEATQSDIMYAVLIHELTHIAEASDTYGELADAVLQIKYGDGVTYKGILDAMKSGDVSSKLAQDVLGKKSIYDRQLNKNHSNEEMLQEIVADCVGYTIAGDQDAMNKLVAEKPSLARRILNSIKSFLKKMVGIEDETVTQAQRIVDMLETALKGAGNMENRGTKYFIGKTTDGREYVDVNADQNIFDGLSPKQILSKAESVIRDRFKGLEVEFADGAAKVTNRTANEYAHPANRRISSDILEAKGRASTELDNLLEVGEQILPGDPDYPATQYSTNHHPNVKKWSYYKTLFKVAGEQFSGIINIARMDDFSRVHDITKIKYDTSWQALQGSDSQGASTGVPDANLTQNGQNVNTIATDEQGNPLATELPDGSVSVDTTRYSLSSFNGQERDRVRQALYNAKNADGTKRFTKQEVDKYLYNAMGIAAKIAQDRTRLDFEASDNQVFLKPNNDYYFTLDASTLCAKRLLYQGTFDYVQHALPDEVFTPEDLIDLVNIMNDMGYETPCGICYVESRRRWLDTYAQKFLDELPDNADAFIDKYFKKATDEEKAEIREHYAEWSPSIDDLTTSDGLEQLRHNNPYMHKAFVDAMNKKGTANPKVVQLRTEYRGDIRDMKAKDIQKVKDIGGLRIQSFSDFETPHLLDMVQAVYDMSAAGLTSQAYTKVPNFAWVFGDTGIKINLSLIGKGTGLDENGNLVFDNREGINFDEAMRLRNRYSKNVGTILVGINDDHIVAAMGDPRIDFIIPFHKSGWSAEELRKMPTLNNYNDYTDTQNERVIIGRNKDGSYVTESFKIHKDRTKESLENFQPVGKNGYWDFSKNGQWNAEKYLKMCAEQHRIPKFSQFLVDNGNGTFSLPQGSDKRSTAIREGYWKTLIDFKMYDNNGVGAAQAEVTPNINMAEAYRVLGDYKLGRQMPDKADGTKGRFIPMESNNSVPVAIPAAEEYIELIKRKRGWSKPAAPGPDTLEADLPSDVVNPRASAFGASTAPAILGNTEGETVEANSAGQNAMAIDAETGETVRYSLPAAIDQVYEDMSTDELWELLGLGSEDEEEARNIMTVAVQDIKDEFDPTIYNGKLYVKPETLDHWLSSGGFASSNPKYAQAYITTMNPEDFLRMTTVTEQGQNRILNEATPLDEEKIGETAMRQPIQLSIDEASGKIVGHEGRHRAVALARAGVTEIPVLLFDSATKYSKEAKPELTLRGQDYGENENGNELTFRDVIPLSSGNRDEITQRFTASAEDEASAAENDQRVLRYSLPSGVENAIYVKDGHKENGETVDFINEMLDGNKKGETRSHKNLTRKQWLGLSKNGQVYGRVRFGEPIQITRESPEYADAMIAGTEYDIKDGESKYYYPIVEMEDFRDDPKPIIKNGNYGQYKFPVADVRYSNPSDAPYLNAVNRGDMKEAQRLVEERAKEVFPNSKLIQDGKFHKMWHHTNKEFTSFLPGTSRSSGGLRGIYFTPQEYSTMSALGNRHNAYYLNVENSKFAFGIDEHEPYVEELKRRQEGVTDREEIARINREFSEETGIDAFFDWQNGWYNMLVPEKIKSADPVTYDDAGNVIPLSERFNTKEKDFRYSLPSDNYLEEMIRQRLGQGNDLTEMDNLPGMPTTENGSAQRQFGSKTAQEGDALHQSVKDYLFTHSSYTPESNQEQIDRAMSWVENKKNDSDPDGYHAALSEVLSTNFDYRSADGQARMLTVMGMAALKGDTENELRLADAYNKQGTDLGRQLQARKIFRLMTPVGRMSVLQKMVRDVNDEYGRQGKTTRVGLSDWTLQAAAAAETEEDFATVRKAAAREIAEQTPANWKDKLRGFRMLSMLGNPRTHIRNIIGNAMFIPAVSLKNKIGAAVEMATGQENRTKTLRPVLSREVRNFAKQDAQTMRDALTGEAKYNDDTMVEREKKAFRGILQVLSDYNSNALEAEDWFFLKGHYRRAFGGWMQANGYTAAQLRSDPKLLETGRAYAIQEAQKATYRDFNGLAAKLQELVRNPKTAGQKALAFGVEAALPFKKTPANILKRGFEYSPIGIAKTLVSDAKGLKQYMDYQNGKLKVMPEGAVSPNQFIDNLCAGLTGTGIMAIGALLGSMGVVSVGLDDDDDEFEKLKGNQAYAIKFNLFGQDVTFTMDWAAPISMPFFVGAALQKELSSDGDMSIEDVLNAIGGISEPVFNLSMLDGVNSLFRTSQNDDTNTLTQIGTKIATNYVTSYVPSILGATARTIDSNRRKAYVESGKGTGVMGTVRYAVEQTENKIPGLSQSNIPYRDVFGRTEESGLGERILENFVLPGYVNRYNQDDEVVNELERIGAVPKMPGKTITVKKERIALTDKQWDAYVTARGQTAYNDLGRLFETDAYQMADKETKNDMVQKVWSYADQIGKNAAVPEYEVKEADPVQTSINDANKATMIRCLKGGDIEGYETMVEALRDAGVEDQAIKQKIGDTYRDLYKAAYLNEDYARMDEIENLLENTGFVFDIGSWEKQADTAK